MSCYFRVFRRNLKLITSPKLNNNSEQKLLFAILFHSTFRALSVFGCHEITSFCMLLQCTVFGKIIMVDDHMN